MVSFSFAASSASSKRPSRLRLALAVSAAIACLASSAIEAKTIVQSETDLPRSVYHLKGSASGLLTGPEADFTKFVDEVDHDVTHLLDEYQIDDHTTLRNLLGIKVSILAYRHDNQAALATLKQIRDLQEKPAAKLMSGLFAQARLEAMIDAKGKGEAAIISGYRAKLEPAVAQLPWDSVGEDLRDVYSFARLHSRAEIVGGVAADIDPETKTSKAVDRASAGVLIASRVSMRDVLAIDSTTAEVLQPIVAKHNQAQKSIWADREVTFSGSDKLTPTLVAIWDSGIDPEDFPNQMFVDPNPSPSGNHGYAFTDEGQVSHDWTYPLKPEYQKRYPDFVRDVKGFDDIRNGVQSAEAIALENETHTSTVASAHERDEIDQWLGFYSHGTHCAGIAARGNPAARLVVARFDDQLPFLPFQPTTEWATRMAENFKNMSTYFRERHVRVVNMSWGDQVSEIETWISRTGGGGDAATRKKKAEEIYGIWKNGVEAAIKNAPDTLFIAAAGNDDVNAQFVGDIPAALHADNIITIGAVDDAGRETSFTSFGPTVLAYADGFQVDSTLPQKQHGKFSGTSMAAPNAVNLAAKLYALDPSLTVADVIGLIRDGSTASADGRYKLINPQGSVALLKKKMTASK